MLKFWSIFSSEGRANIQFNIIMLLGASLYIRLRFKTLIVQFVAVWDRVLYSLCFSLINCKQLFFSIFCELCQELFFPYDVLLGPHKTKFSLIPAQIAVKRIFGINATKSNSRNKQINHFGEVPRNMWYYIKMYDMSITIFTRRSLPHPKTSL